MSSLDFLPPQFDFNHPAILNQTIEAARKLGQLNGELKTIPNEAVLFNILPLQEAKDSSAIENIITTHDELLTINLEGQDKLNISPDTKEANNYFEAIIEGYGLITKNKLLTVNIIKAIQKVNCPAYADFRKLPGTQIKNPKTDKVIYTPPQDHNEIVKLMADLEKFINEKDFCNLDPSYQDDHYSSSV